jgi:hypothetical protein
MDYNIILIDIMNISTNIQSIIIQFLKVKELKKIKTINKVFYNDLIKNKRTIQIMIERETYIKRKTFLYNHLSEIITDILLIKYHDIDTLYNKFGNYFDLLKDILNLIINHKFDPYKNYAMNFVYIDMIIIKTLTKLYTPERFVFFINECLDRTKYDPKIHLFIYLISKRLIYSCNNSYYWNQNTQNYDYEP